LLIRKEVDPARIGITGRSGGGTQRAYIAAFDERIYAAAPEGWMTNFTRQFQHIGPQDAEQNLFNGIVRGAILDSGITKKGNMEIMEMRESCSRDGLI